MERLVLLEDAAEQVCEAALEQPPLFELPPGEGRAALDRAQDAPVCKYPATVTTVEVETSQWGSVLLHHVRPDCLAGTPGVIYYLHGAGWVFGDLHTHDKLVRELAARTNSVVLFPEYSLSPEARYPTALEQCYEILCNLPDMAQRFGWALDFGTLTVAGDSAGGNLATVLTLLAKERGGIAIHKQLLYYPVTAANFSTGSYNAFADGYYLSREGMMWFWDQYLPDEEQRRAVTASPLRAAPEQLRGLPDAMILCGEADVLRDEGEAYAQKLRLAGVEVTAMRLQATIHDFVMLNALDESCACRAAMDASTEWINRKNGQYPDPTENILYQR